MQNRTKYQEKIIKNYYENRDAIALQRAQEIVTELYLTEGKKREKHWKNLVGHLEKLGFNQKRIDILVQKDDPAAVASALQKLIAES